MRKIFNDDASLTEEGKSIFLDFNIGLSRAMHSDQAHDMGEDELLILSTHMHKVIGDAITNRISCKRQLKAKLQVMTDQEFDTYLKAKYGDNWFIHGLEPEELARVPLSDFQKLADEMTSVSQEIMKHMNCNGVRLK